jgi:hypothetical protein
MPFTAHVVQVLIASPGDVAAERKALREAIWAWNDEHAAAYGVVLLPVGWETHSRPELGDHPQHLIDRQLAERADVLIGVFWTRLGTATPEAASGTVHEVESFRAAGKDVQLYFSTVPAALDTVDLDQLKAVRDFRKQAEGWGLLGQYDDIPSLVDQTRRALLKLVREHFNLPPAVLPTGAGAGRPRVLASVEREREQTGIDKQGKFKHTTRHWLKLANEGGSTARAVTVAWADEGPLIHDGDKPIDYLVHGSPIRLPVLAFGTTSPRTLHLTWQDEGGESYEDHQTLRV